MTSGETSDIAERTTRGFTDLDLLRPADDLADARLLGNVAQRLFGTRGVSTRLGRFSILEKVGQGGIGIVYAAYDPKLDRRVAIKVLLASEGSAPREATQRMVREARAAARLAHPNIVSVFDVDEADGRIYIAMEYVPGPTLGQWLRDDKPSNAEISNVFGQAGRGLAAAHRGGIVHRDFKPANVIVAHDGQELRARVVDFGLAWLDTSTPATWKSSSEELVDSNEDEGPLTRTGQRLGTPAYMSPQQREGQATDARTDQYSFCVALYEAFTGSRPSQDDGAVPSAGLPSHVRAVVRRGLAVRPDDRYPSMDALLRELQPEPKRRWWPLILALLGLGGTVVAASTLARPPEPCPASTRARELWNEPRIADVAAAFEGSGLAYAQASWVTVREQLDGRLSAWTETSRQVCIDAITGELSHEVHARASLCLERRWQELDAFVEELGDTTLVTLEHSAAAASALPSSSICRDLEWLLATVPQPAQPQIAAQVAEVREVLTRSRVAQLLGSVSEARRLGEEARRMLPRGLFPLADAEVDWRVAAVQAALDVDQEEVLRRAFLIAEREGGQRLKVRIAASLAHLRSNRTNDTGQLWADIGLASAASIDPNGHLYAFALGTSAEVAFNTGNYTRSLDEASRGLELLLRSGDESLEVSIAHTRRARASYALGHLDEALAAAEVAYDKGIALVGTQHPSQAAAANLIGTILRRLERYDEAMKWHQRALDVFMEAYGPDHSEIAISRTALATVAEMQDDFPRAEREYLAALAILEAIDRESAHVATTTENLAILYARQGKLVPAEELMRHALTLAIARLGPEHPELAFTYGNIGTVLGDQQRHADALPFHQRAVELTEDTLGAEHPRLATRLYGLAQALHRSDRHAEALVAVDRAIEIIGKSAEPGPKRSLDEAALRTAILAALGEEAAVPSLRE